MLHDVNCPSPTLKIISFPFILTSFWTAHMKFSRMFTHHTRQKPSAYPRLPFHAIRAFQLISSVIVSSILFYFTSSLSTSHHSLPWTFILLLSTALLTILTLACTFALHQFHGLNPILALSINAVLGILWAVSFALLSWWSSGTLAHVCTEDNWENETGIAVCRMYKVLFSFSLLGLVAALVALGLDVHVKKQAGARGQFQTIGMGAGSDGKGRAEDRAGGAGAGREGYALPEEQFAYADDTGYHGAAGQVGRRSAEQRL
ncbi:hypothetical protein HBH70_125490 [Parastagonospora nodorum]|nr:hypothetical protein HBH53_242220 [Parastagonospora nodorum]KAH3964528.1 hypothetical protein HBH51_159570 [Parastagonospora nodorum]KAH4159945.1 hypothetical protein HBH43_186450 [Parastagonospora nodorum]KAH4980613.1 hypothetical protein HBI76_183410 [Parastagonospora nodorum]KAH5135963.1 hypothetical protein HBH70_125490 [Parastagonospora nodorum]